MDIQTVKLDVIQKLMAVDRPSLLDKINRLLDKELIVGYTTDGKPLTKEAYDKRLKKADLEIQKGKVISSTLLKEEIKNW